MSLEIKERKDKIGLVSKSFMKKFAGYFVGFEYVTNQEMIEAVSQTEHQNTEQAVITPYYKFGIPYPLYVAGEKAKGAIAFLEKRGEEKERFFDFYVVSDAVWVVHGRALNKGLSDGADRTKDLFNFYIHEARGKPIRSEGGIAVINPRDLSFRLFRSILNVGIVNPELDGDSLLNTLSENPNSAGGLSFNSALKNGIILPYDFLSYEVRSYNPVHEVVRDVDKGGFLGGQLISSDHVLRGELSFADRKNFYHFNYLSQGLFHPPPLLPL